MSTGKVAIGVLMASFLVWLWRNSPETEDEVWAWLEKHNLESIRHLSPIRGTCKYMYMYVQSSVQYVCTVHVHSALLVGIHTISSFLCV